MEISLLRPDAVRLPPTGRGWALGLAGAAKFDCAEACCWTGDSDGDNKALISMSDSDPDPTVWIKLLKGARAMGPY
jgi:hypothetical protein